MIEVHLTRSELKVLKVLRQREEDEETRATELPVLADRLQQSPDRVLRDLYRLSEAELIHIGGYEHGSHYVQLFNLSHAGRQFLRGHGPLALLKRWLGVLVGTLTTALVGALAQSAFTAPSTGTHVTVVIVATATGTLAGVFGGAKLEDLLP